MRSDLLPVTPAEYLVRKENDKIKACIMSTGIMKYKHTLTVSKLPGKWIYDGKINNSRVYLVCMITYTI